MKRTLLIAALAFVCIGASAQQTLTLSTYKGTDLTQYDGKTLNVSVSRYLYKGWNTISLPFAMTEAQVNAAFGTDCRLEKLVGVENDGMKVKLNFQNCKSEGIRPNTPYILFYTGDNGSKRFTAENVKVSKGQATVSFTAEGTGETVTMGGANEQTASDGLYGILARDNAEASFVNVDNINTGFGATRCFITLPSGNNTNLVTTHNAETTGISSSLKDDVGMNSDTPVYNLSGQQMKTVQKGVNIINGRKVIVK
jgi:hypothetical protein